MSHACPGIIFANFSQKKKKPPFISTKVQSKTVTVQTKL